MVCVCDSPDSIDLLLHDLLFGECSHWVVLAVVVVPFGVGHLKFMYPGSTWIDFLAFFFSRSVDDARPFRMIVNNQLSPFFFSFSFVFLRTSIRRDGYLRWHNFRQDFLWPSSPFCFGFSSVLCHFEQPIPSNRQHLYSTYFMSMTFVFFLSFFVAWSLECRRLTKFDLFVFSLPPPPPLFCNCHQWPQTLNRNICGWDCNNNRQPKNLDVHDHSSHSWHFAKLRKTFDDLWFPSYLLDIVSSRRFFCCLCLFFIISFFPNFVLLILSTNLFWSFASCCCANVMEWHKIWKQVIALRMCLCVCVIVELTWRDHNLFQLPVRTHTIAQL